MLRDELSALSRAKKIVCETYVYNAIFNTLPGAGQLAINVNISNDSDFAIRATTLVSYSAVGIIVVAPDYTMQLLDSSSGRQLQDTPVHVGNWTGTAQLPYVWPEPYIVKGGGTLVVTLINNTAVAALVTVSFHGMKIFYMNSYSR